MRCVSRLALSQRTTSELFPGELLSPRASVGPSPGSGSRRGRGEQGASASASARAARFIIRSGSSPRIAAADSTRSISGTGDIVDSVTTVDPMAQNPWTLHFTDAEIEREYLALQWGARRRLLRVAVPPAAAVAAATVLWTVRYPEHAGDVMVPAADVPRLAWIAAGATVLAGAWLLAIPLSDNTEGMGSRIWPLSLIAGNEMVPRSDGFFRRAMNMSGFSLAAPSKILQRSNSLALEAPRGWKRRLEPILALIIGLLCLAYSVACVEAGAARSAEMHALVLLAAFAASFVFLADSTAVAGQSFRTTTRSTFNILLLLRASV